MPLPRSVAHFNRRITNRVLGPLAYWLPHFGIVVHRGRKSGREYRTPVNVFRRPGGFVVALTYGPDSDWVHNVLAAGGATLITRGRPVRLTNPRLVHDETRRAVPRVLRLVGRLGRVSYFLDLSLVTSSVSVVPAWVGAFNGIARGLLAAGVPMGPNGLITIRGRKTGLPCTTPLTFVQAQGRYWVLGVYGEVDWVRNLRAAGGGVISKQRRHAQVAARELSPTEAVVFFRDVFAPNVRRYGGLGAWIVRHVDKIDIDDPVAAAAGRPVFELTPIPRDAPHQCAGGWLNTRGGRGDHAADGNAVRLALPPNAARP
jgi:deazaflavin-dependent oxidoreductase (nitroreductase family)